jgi:hypothetical protein
VHHVAGHGHRPALPKVEDVRECECGVFHFTDFKRDDAEMGPDDLLEHPQINASEHPRIVAPKPHTARGRRLLWGRVVPAVPVCLLLSLAEHSVSFQKPIVLDPEGDDSMGQAAAEEAPS